ncbi:MAG: radical SAM protein [Candidatus Nanoarchaeia archaeon]
MNVNGSKVELFQIPFQGKFIVYAPLKQIAFIANKALVSLIASLMNHKKVERRTAQAVKFIKKTGILEPDPEVQSYNPVDYKPVCAVLFLTNRCNLGCVYCYARSNESPAVEMNPEVAYKAIDVVAENAAERNLDTFELSFHGGGEPTLNWDTLKKAVFYARKKKLKVSVNASSNGYLSLEKRSFICQNFDGLSLSFDGPPDVQNKQRPTLSGKDSFRVVMKTIEEFDKKSFPYGVRMTVTKDSASSLARMVSFVCQETGAKTIQVEPAFPRGRGEGKELTTKSMKKFVDQFLEALNVAESNGRTFFYSGARIDSISNRFCLASSEALVVSQRGEITTCFETHNTSYPMAEDFFIGSIGPDGLKIDLVKWKRIVNRTSDKIRYCHGCFCRWHCAGDCLSKTFSPSSEDNFIPSWRCIISQEITKVLLLRKISQSKGVWLGQ